MAGNLFFFKFTARDTVQRTFVLGCGVVNKQKNSVDKFEILVSHANDCININSEYTYRDTVSRIQKYILEGHSVTSATQSLGNYFRNAFATETFLMELIYYLEFNNLEKLTEQLRNILGRVLGKDDFPVTAYITNLDKEELEKPSQAEVQAAAEAAQPKEETVRSAMVPADALEGKFSFVLSPVTGTRADELKIGDRIMIRLTEEDESSKNIINLLMIKDEAGNIRSVPATIVDFKKTSKEVMIIVKVTDGVFAKNVETETAIKVRMAGFETLSSIIAGEYNPVLDKSGDVKKESDFQVSSFMVLSVVVLLIIAWVVIYFFVL